MVAERTLRFSLTWGLGGMAVVLVLLQLGTGLLLKFVFEPTPVGAYESIRAFQDRLLFGQLVRNLHHWCANLLVLIAFLHMLRVFFTGAFQSPRQFNWIIGLMMFGVVLAANLTGYLLPYDQLAYWAVPYPPACWNTFPSSGCICRRQSEAAKKSAPPRCASFSLFIRPWCRPRFLF
jgi:quinol-cytochrome oxidoreductase complex cytochrome b subunit